MVTVSQQILFSIHSPNTTQRSVIVEKGGVLFSRDTRIYYVELYNCLFQDCKSENPRSEIFEVGVFDAKSLLNPSLQTWAQVNYGVRKL